jgi:hypothetical protein
LVEYDDGVDAVVVEERKEVRGFGADGQGVVAAAGRENHDYPCIEAAIHRVKLDRRVVNVDDAVDAARHGLAHGVLLGLADAFCFEVIRTRRGTG